MPSVGILTMPGSVTLGPEPISYLTHDDYTWFRRAGIKVVPIPVGILEDDVLAYFSQIQGLYLPGGPFIEPTYKRLAFRFLDLAYEANRRGRQFPVWGTCHGFQMMLLWAGGAPLKLDSLDAMRRQDPTLRLVETESRLFQSHAIRARHLHVSHSLGITTDHFRQNRRLAALFRILATSHDRSGTEYVSAMEGINVPFYGVQFHPEMNRSLDWMATFFKKEMGAAATAANPIHTFSLTPSHLRPCGTAWNEYDHDRKTPQCFVFCGRP